MGVLLMAENPTAGMPSCVCVCVGVFGGGVTICISDHSVCATHWSDDSTVSTSWEDLFLQFYVAIATENWSRSP